MLTEGAEALAARGAGPSQPVDPRELLGEALHPPRAAVRPPRGPGDQVVAAIYRTHYGPLVREATGLLHDAASAEDIVQDAFTAVCSSWQELRSQDKAAPYLRRCVLNGAWSLLRRRTMADRYLPLLALDAPRTQEIDPVLLERSTLRSAVRGLARRQRQAVILRYYAGLTEAQTAAVMGISRGAVKNHTFRAITSLRRTMTGRGVPVAPGAVGSPIRERHAGGGARTGRRGRSASP